MEDKFHLIAERKSRDLKQHLITLHLPQDIPFQDGNTTEIKVARTTTIINLKHKVQDKHGIPFEEQTIHVLGQQKGSQNETNVLQLLPQAIKILEVKWIRKDGSTALKPATVKKAVAQSLSAGTPYDSKPQSKKKLTEFSSIHPKKQIKVEGAPGTVKILLHKTACML